MNVPTYTHHSGWPWPLDAVQDWFESLWDTIWESAKWVAGKVWEWIPKEIRTVFEWLADLGKISVEKLKDFFKDPLGSIKKGFDWVISGITDLVGWWDPKQGRFVGGFLGWLWDSVASMETWISDAASWIDEKVTTLASDFSKVVTGAITLIGNTISEGLEWLLTKAEESIDGALTWASDKLDWLVGEVNAGLDWAVDRVGTMFDGALGVIGDVIGSVFSGPLGVLTGPFTFFLGAFGGANISDHAANITGIFDGINSSYQSLITAHSPMTPEDAFASTTTWRGQQRDYWYQAYISALVIEMGSMGQLETPNMMILTEPQMKASLTLAQEWYAAPYKYGYGPLIEQYWNSVYMPLLPPVVDLIRFVVREVIPPTEFDRLMPYLGFSATIAKWYWEAHWVLPSPEHIYDAYHRNVINVTERDKYIVWHDYKPEPRPGIRVSDQTIMGSLTKTLIPRVDLRRGLRLGRLARTDLDERYGWLGYEEDAELMADIQVAVAYEAEINKLRDNAKDDFVNGFSIEATLRADLEAIGLSPEVVEYHVADAKADRERAHKKKLLAIYEDAYLKEIKTDEELAADASLVIVDPEALELYLNDAYVTKYKKSKPVETSEERIARAEGQVMLYTSTVDKASEDVEEYEAYMKETADVFDAQIAAKETELAAAVEPEAIRKLEDAITILGERREARMVSMAASLTSLDHKLTDAEIKLALAQAEVTRLRAG